MMRIYTFIACLAMMALLAPGMLSATDNLPLMPSRTVLADRLQSLADNQNTDASDKTDGGMRPLHDLGYAARTFLSDAGRIYSSPARLNKRSALWLGGILAVGGTLYAFDQDVFDAFQRNKDESWYKPIRKTGENLERLGYMGATNKYFFGMLIAGYVTRYRPLLSLSSDIIESHFIAGGVKNMANLAMGRARPFEGEGPYYFRFNEGTSFPSGHASNIVQMAVVFSDHVNFTPFTVLAYTVAGTVCLERITSEAHWPSDVYFAAVYGWLVSREILSLNESRRLRVAAAPTADGAILHFRFSF